MPGAGRSREAATRRGRARRINWGRLARRHGWTIGVYVLLFGLLLYWRTIPAQWGTFDVQSLAIDALPFAFAAMAQAVVIISGGIDLSIGSMMGLVNVLSAKYMFDATTGLAVSYREALVLAVVLILGAGLAGALTGLIINVTKVADIIVTLAMLFVWGGAALAVMQIPGGGTPLEFSKLAIGYTFTPWLPSGLVILARRRPARLGADPLAEARAGALRDRLEPERVLPLRHLRRVDAGRRLRARDARSRRWAGWR